MHRKIPLPRGWKRRVRSSVLHILALSHYTFTALLAKAALSKNRQVRLQALYLVQRFAFLLASGVVVQRFLYFAPGQ